MTCASCETRKWLRGEIGGLKENRAVVVREATEIGDLKENHAVVVRKGMEIVAARR